MCVNLGAVKWIIIGQVLSSFMHRAIGVCMKILLGASLCYFMNCTITIMYIIILQTSSKDVQYALAQEYQ